jgi:hypothetical protein
MSRKHLNHAHLGVVMDIQGLIELTNLICDGKDQIISWVSIDTGKLNKIKFTQSEYVKADDRNTNSDMSNAKTNGRALEADSNLYVETGGTRYFSLGVHPSNDDAICPEN